MRLSAFAIAICLSIEAICAGTQAEQAIRRPTSIAPQGLAQALQTLAKDCDVQLVYRSELVHDRLTNGASGMLTLDEVLVQLLGGTGLMYRYLDHNAITIVPSQ